MEEPRVLFELRYGLRRVRPSSAGCRLEEVQSMRQWAAENVPQKPICGIARWFLINMLSIPQDTSELFNRFRLQLLLVAGLEIHFDERHRGFHSVLSTPALNFQNDCLIETRNTLYLLIGPGEEADISYQEYAGAHASDRLDRQIFSLLVPVGSIERGH